MTATRHLFIITRADTVGGAQIHVRDLSKHLLSLGRQVLVVTGPAGPYTDALNEAGVESVTIDALRNPIHPARDARAIAEVRAVIRRFAPDLISTHSSKAGIVGRLAGALEGVPCLFTAHGWAFTTGVPEPSRSVYRLVERCAANLGPRIVCVSEYDRQIGLKAGIPANRLRTIHNGMPDIPATLLADPGRPGEPFRIAMVARLDDQKDHPTLLAALRELPDVHLDLIGDGPKTDQMVDLAREYGLAERVHFLGRRTDVANILSRAHVFALISNWEGFPRSTLEAMRAGLPVVVSDVGGSSEAVEEGLSGFCVPRGDVAAVRDRLASLVADSALRRRMGQASRERYEAEFTFSRMFEKTLGVYEDVLANDGQGVSR